MKAINGDVGLAVVVIALATVYLVADMHLPETRISDPLGPKAFPALVAIGLIGSAVLLLLERASRARHEGTAVAAAHDESQPANRPLVLIGMVAWTALYYACFNPVGYLISTVVFLFGLLSCFHRGHVKTNLAVAFGFAILFDLLFSKVLGVPMPNGILPF
jgi:putative tricarboxylic transport membrane protein